MMFKAWPKIPRLVNERFHVTEKIDGTNACIIIQETKADITNVLAQYQENDIEFGIWAQSRTRIITPEDDNYGFAKWVQGNAEQLIKDLGVGYHFGEWWGRGIQRQYNLTEKRFSLFNPTKQSSICHNVPKILETDIMPDDQKLLNHIKNHGSFAAPGFMNPEGLVVYAEQAKTHWKIILNK